jgi:hypothetical protein
METVERTLFREKIITSKIVAKLYRCETTCNHIPWCEIDVEENNKVIANYFIQNDLTKFYVDGEYCIGEREFIEICISSLFKDDIDSIIKPFMEELQSIIDDLNDKIKEQEKIKERYDSMEDFYSLTKEEFSILSNAESQIEHLEIEIEDIKEKYHVL